MTSVATGPISTTINGGHLRLPVVESWAEWGEVFTDLAWWEPAVREICDHAGVPVHTVEAGYPGTNAVFVVWDAAGKASHVVKIYAPFCYEDYDLELMLHPLLVRDAPDLGAPYLIAHGTLEAERDWPYVILSFVRGRPIREAREDLSPAALMSIASDLGERVRSLHAIPVEPLRGIAALAPDWPSYVVRQTDRVVNQLRRKRRGKQTRSGGKADKRQANRLLDEGVLREVPGFIAAEMATVSERDLVLVNGDLTEDHVLLRRASATWTISGIIDFADARLAPRAYEWPALWFSALDRDPGALSAFMERYDPYQVLDDAFFRRAMAFTFLHEFGVLIIEATLEDLDYPAVRSLAHLQRLLWQPQT